MSSWMYANLLTLNSSKTEFLLIGLKQQLAKINSCSQPTPLLPLSFTLSLTTATHFTMTYLNIS